MKRLLSLSVSHLVLFSALSPLALAQADSAVLDSGGMPVCQLRADGQEFVRFEWSQDAYQRDVYVEKLPRQGFTANTGSQVVDLYQTYCANSPDRQYDSSTTVSSTRVKLAAGQSQALTYTLDPSVLPLFDQVRLGGNVALASSELTADKYFAAHPTASYDVKLNREITLKYGMGFSAGYFKKYLDTRPTNAGFKSRVDSYLNSQSTLAGNIPLADRYKGYTFALVRGYAFTLGDNSRYSGMTQDLVDAGLNVKVLDNLPFAPIEQNRQIVMQEVQELIAQGQKVILIPASKGAPEALGAASDIAAANGGNIDGVAAVISLSSMIDGAMVVDWAGGFLVWPFARGELFKEFNAQGGNLTSSSQLDPMLDMETSKIASFYTEHPLSNLITPVYVNLVGTPLGNGLVRDPGVLAIQNSVIRPYLSKDHGASDGYIEFPGTVVPDAPGRKTYSLAFNASHAILDGDYEGHLMGDDASRTGVLRSILASLADVLDGSFNP